MAIQTQEGWSVLIQGAARFVDSDEELAPIARLGVHAWPGGPKEQFIGNPRPHHWPAHPKDLRNIRRVASELRRRPRALSGH